MTSLLRPAPRRLLIATRIIGLVAVGALAQACGSAPPVDTTASVGSVTTAPVSTSPAPTTTATPTTAPVATEAPVAPAAAVPRIVPTTVRRAPQPLVAAPRPAPKPAPKPVVAAPKPAPKPALKPAAVSYANCTAVKAAGAAPIRRGDPGYSTKLDRDGDGIACET